MTRPVILRDEAEEDIRNHFDELERARTGFGRVFATQLRQLLE